MHQQYFVRTTFLSWRKRWELEANKQLEKITNNEYIYTVQYNVKYLTILPRTLVVFSAKTCPPYATTIANEYNKPEIFKSHLIFSQIALFAVHYYLTIQNSDSFTQSASGY